MMLDPCHIVRVIVASGVCRICATFWEMLPAKVIHSFLTTLVTNLAWDSASADVRQAVLVVSTPSRV